MNIYDDNRLTRWGQRRLHSAFEEIGGDRTWTVPTIAREIAPAVTPYDWDRGRRTIEAAIQAGDEPLRHRVQLSEAPAVVDVEDAMLRWAKDHPQELAQVALLAYWPEDRNTSDTEVIKTAHACLRAIGRGGTPRMAGFAIEQVNIFGYDAQWMQTLRDEPVTRTREAERRHPRRDENHPPELDIRDPGATRMLRPARLRAPYGRNRGRDRDA